MSEDQEAKGNGDYGTVEYETDDDNLELPSILARPSNRPNSRHQNRTVESYIAPENLRDKVVQFKEFPHGVYINHAGELCPKDPRSNRIRTRVRPTAANGPDDAVPADDIASAEDDEDEENDENDDDDGMYWRETGDSGKKRKRSDEDEDAEEEEDGEWSGAEDEDDNDEDEDEDDNDEAEEDNEKAKEEEEEEEDGEITQQSLVDDLKQGADDTAKFHEVARASKKRVLHAQKLIHFMQDIELAWQSYRAEQIRKIHKSMAGTPRNEQNKYYPVMTYDTNFHVSEPHGHVLFKKKDRTPTRMNIDCQFVHLVCTCGTTPLKFHDVPQITEHLVASHGW